MTKAGERLLDAGKEAESDAAVRSLWRWAAIENIAIFAAIAAITVGGVWLSGEWHGLWSLLLVFCCNSPSTIYKLRNNIKT